MLLTCGGTNPRVVLHWLSGDESTVERGVITWRPTPRPGSPGNSNSEEPASVALRGRETDQDDADGVEIGPPAHSLWTGAVMDPTPTGRRE
jgi:hypothetical protein